MNRDVRYTLDERAYLAANREHVMLLLSNGAWPIFSALFGVVVAVLLLADPSTTIPVAAAIGVVAALVFWALGVGLSLVTLPRRSRYLFRQQPVMAEEVRATWDADAFRTESESATSRVRWGDFVRWADSEEALLLFSNDLIFYILPKRVFDEPTRADILAQLAAHNVPPMRRWRHIRRPATRKERP